ncbi:MAG: 50S ribosomal protein L25/general stress protein Ctc [Bacteroidales bacterium]|nr:50S ribosomal protein L25/general stress protein Ctc [Bacteroidales bacterium]
MKTLEISGKLRTETGKAGSKQLRKSEMVPCIIYGGDVNINFYAHKNSFRNLVYTPDAHIVNLDLEGKKMKIVMKDIQFHPVSDEILHIDFMHVHDSKPVVIEIPMKVTGDSPGVKAGGKLRIKLRKLKVKGLVSDIPEVINVDISGLQVHQSIKAGDLQIDKVEILDSPKSLILSIATARGLVKTEEEEAAEAAEAEGKTETETPAE